MNRCALHHFDRARLVTLERARQAHEPFAKRVGSLYTAMASTFVSGLMIFGYLFPDLQMTAWQAAIWLGTLPIMIASLLLLFPIIRQDWWFFKEIHQIKSGSELRGQTKFGAWWIIFSAYLRDRHS